ncbi:MAG: acyltransferase, partial [Sulfurimonas sp.]|nr:acyltransferase [Sulfurimonas sp.]
MNQLSFIQKIKNKIRIDGKNNKILVEGSIKISKIKIVIKGSNNTLHIKSGAKINSSFLEIVGDNCSIIIGKNSIIGNGCYLSAKEKDITLSIG